MHEEGRRTEEIPTKELDVKITQYAVTVSNER